MRLPVKDTLVRQKFRAAAAGRIFLSRNFGGFFLPTHYREAHLEIRGRLHNARGDDSESRKSGRSNFNQGLSEILTPQKTSVLWLSWLRTAMFVDSIDYVGCCCVVARTVERGCDVGRCGEHALMAR